MAELPELMLEGEPVKVIVTGGGVVEKFQYGPCVVVHVTAASATGVFKKESVCRKSFDTIPHVAPPVPLRLCTYQYISVPAGTEGITYELHTAANSAV